MADISWRDAVLRVLRANEGPMHYTEIANRIVELGLRQKVGATPAATVSRLLTDSINDKGTRSPYERVERGRYRLSGSAPARTPPSADTAHAEDASPQLLTSYGVFWNRDAVEWKIRPVLLGVYQTDRVSKIEPEPVDFSEQRGVYLLHDGREVIYVGRTTKRDLGRRLFEHTKDRLQGRWDRFSWFGFRPVRTDGTLGPKVEGLSPEHEMDSLIEVVEAILIEAVEPRQNRRQGDGIREFEFRQVPDSEVQKKIIARKIIDQL